MMPNGGSIFFSKIFHFQNKFRVGELEAGLRHKDWQLGETERRIREIEQQNRQLKEELESKIRELRDSFVVRKSPYVDRQKWQLSSWLTNLFFLSKMLFLGKMQSRNICPYNEFGLM